jgi:ribulose-5-phosphate 4-epimerase/fuculose-1-phosphate aldolase
MHVVYDFEIEKWGASLRFRRCSERSTLGDQMNIDSRATAPVYDESNYLIKLSPPEFQSIEDERLHRKQRLAGALRIFGRFGFSEGVAGHITARDPELSDHFWVNPFGMSFRHVKVSDLILVSHAGEVVYGDRPVNPAAFAIHSAIHAARPDVVAAAHAHSVFGKAWSSLGRPLDPITQDACVFFEDHSVCAEGGGAIVLEENAAKELVSALGTFKATIHRNHGLFTVGSSVDEAASWFIKMERACQGQLLTESVGAPILIDDDSARYTRDRTGSHLAGWFSFQPLWEEILRSDPDFLE